MSDLRKLVQVMFPTVKAQPIDYLDVVREELTLLGIDAHEEVILCAASIIKAAPNLEDALKCSDTLGVSDISARAKAEEDSGAPHRDQKEQVVQHEAAARKGVEGGKTDRQKDIDELADAIVQKARDVLGDNPDMLRMLPVEYCDYSAVCVMGDDITKMTKPMKVVMKEGWVPLGGIHVTYNQETGAMLFSQAIGLPKRRTRK